LLILSLLSEWVDTVPEIDENALAVELTPSGTIGNDEDIIKRRKKEQKKMRKLREQDEKEDAEFKEMLKRNKHGVTGTVDDELKSLDNQVPIGIGLTPLLLATASERYQSLSCKFTNVYEIMFK
jgi:hypothetical protein